MAFVFDVSQLSLAHIDSMEKVDATMQNVSILVRRLHTLRNSFAPINARLPKEILCEIFLHLTSSRGPLRSFTEVNICRYWRDTALEYPRLWTNISLKRGIGWPSLQLSRSKQAPLRIVSHDTSAIGESFLRMILKELPRTNELDVQVPHRLWHEFVAKLPDASALETLHLRVAFQAHLSVATSPLPRLRRLTLEGLPLFTTRALLSSTLTRLVIREVPVVQPVSEWVGALAGLPALQVLSLSDAFRRQNDNVTLPPSASRSHFPCLRGLALREQWDGKTSAYFLRSIALPASAAITFRGKTDEAEEHGDIYRAIIEKLEDETYSAASPPLSCRISNDTLAPQGVTLSLWNMQETAESIMHADKRLRPEPQVSVLWYGGGDEPCLSGVLDNFLRYATSIRLRTLCFEGALKLDAHAWNRCHQLEDLRDLYLGRYAPVALSDFLTEPIDDQPFLNLDTLTLSGIPWTRDHANHKRSTRKDPMVDLWDTLAWREQYGRIIRRVNIDKARNIRSGEMARLAILAERRGLVSQVFEWNIEEKGPIYDCSTCSSSGLSDFL